MITIPSDIFEYDLSCWLEQQTLHCQAEDKAADVKKWYIVNTGKVTYKETLDYST